MSRGLGDVYKRQVQKDRVTIDEDILTHSMQGAETIVRMGERIGKVRD